MSDLAAFFRLYFLFLKHGFDIAHTHTAKAGFLGRVAAKLAGVKMVIHTPHGNNFYGYFGKVGSALVVWLERFADCFTDRTIVLTELEKKDLIAYGVSKKEKIFVVPSGLELEEYSKGKADIAAKRQELGVSDANEAVVAMIGRLEPVKLALLELKKKKVLTEVVNLVIPGLNDSEADLEGLSGWVRTNLGAETPLFFSRFSPNYLLNEAPPTPVATLERARAAAKKQGLKFVYAGNAPGQGGEDTVCPKCGKVLVRRYGYAVLENHLAATGGRCPADGTKIPGIWK